jgi:hypothetical protein
LINDLLRPEAKTSGLFSLDNSARHFLISNLKSQSHTAGTVGPPMPPKPAIAPLNTEQARHHPEAWAKYLNVPLKHTNVLGMKFSVIPPGEFWSFNSKPQASPLDFAYAYGSPLNENSQYATKSSPRVWSPFGPGKSRPDANSLLRSHPIQRRTSYIFSRNEHAISYLVGKVGQNGRGVVRRFAAMTCFPMIPLSRDRADRKSPAASKKSPKAGCHKDARELALPT